MELKYQVLLWIAAAGAFGGFVDGLLSEKIYSLRFGKEMKNLGSVGDCLVGATAGIAIFSVAGSLLNVDFTAMSGPGEFVRVIALGVLSGFAGIRLLQPMTEGFVKKLASEEAQKKFKSLVTESVEASMDINLANGCITKYEATEKVPEVKDEERQKMLTDAEKAVARVLQREPTNLEALRTKGKVLKRQAELKKDSKDKIPLYSEAITITDRMIEINPQSDIGYYNRACYKALLWNLERNRSVPDVLDDLGEAIKLSELNRERAKTDPDFDSIKTEELFLELTGQKFFTATGGKRKS
jgi:hypothetical protein